MSPLVQPDLKPCPHCGSAAFLGHIDEEDQFGPDDDFYWVVCTGCQAWIGGLVDDSTLETVIAQWNRRVGEVA